METTIYPFGTNGELPSSIGIINDLTTGGANKALSAEMGKKLNLDIHGGWVSFSVSWAVVGKYLNTSAVLTTSSDWSVSAPIYLSKGSAIRIGTQGHNFTAIASTDANGTSYTKLVAGRSSNNNQNNLYTYYVAASDMYIAVSGKTALGDVYVDVYSNVINLPAIDASDNSYTYNYITTSGSISTASTNIIITIANNGYTKAKFSSRISTSGLVIACYSGEPSSSTFLYGVIGNNSYTDYELPIQEGVKNIVYSNTPSSGANRIVLYGRSENIMSVGSLGESSSPISQSAFTQWIKRLTSWKVSPIIFTHQVGVHQANTETAIENAILNGKKFIEIDVGITSDFIPIITHEDVQNTTYSDYITDNPNAITLNQALLLAKKNGVVLELDLSYARMTLASQYEVIVNAVKNWNMTSHVVLTLEANYIKVNIDIFTGCILCIASNGTDVAMCDNADEIQPYIPYVLISRQGTAMTRERVEYIHNRGYAVRTYGNPTDYSSVVNMGVDILII